MNYRSQLKGWAVDRVIELWKVTGAPQSPNVLETLKEQADDLTVYCYIPEKDFSDTLAYLAKLLKEVSDPLDKINQMQMELGVIQEEIERQVAMRNAAANGKDNTKGALQ